jgi:Zn-dependent protease
MLLCGFGWAKPVPVDMRYFRKPKQGMAITALAGPVSNLALAFLAMALASLIAHMSGGNLSNFTYQVFYFLLQTALLSIGLGLFNLVPIPPLDGSKVLFSFLPEKVYYTIMRYERFGMLILLVIVWMDLGGSYLTNAIQVVYQWMAGLFF